MLGKDAPDGWIPKDALGEQINLDPVGNAKHQATLERKHGCSWRRGTWRTERETFGT